MNLSFKIGENTYHKGFGIFRIIKTEKTAPNGRKGEDVYKTQLLYSGCTNPAFMNNTMSFYFVELKNDWELMKQKLDDMEFVEPVFLTEEEVEEFIEGPDAAIAQQFAWLSYKSIK